MTCARSPSATLLTVPIPPMPPVQVVRPPEEQRRAKRLKRIGALLLVVGVLLFVVPSAVVHGLCAFVPCSPLRPEVGFSLTEDGRTAVETGRAAAVDLQELVVMSGVDPSWGESPVIWKVERTGDVPADWSGEIVLGEVPVGFDEAVALTVPLTDGTAVGVSNGCYFSTAPVPAGPVPPGVVTLEYEQRPTDEFRATNTGFTPCAPEDDPSRPWIGASMLLGLALGAVGLACVIVAGYRYGPTTRRRGAA